MKTLDMFGAVSLVGHSGEARDRDTRLRNRNDPRQFSLQPHPTTFVILTQVGTHGANGKRGVAVGSQAEHLARAAYGSQHRLR